MDKLAQSTEITYRSASWNTRLGNLFLDFIFVNIFVIALSICLGIICALTIREAPPSWFSFMYGIVLYIIYFIYSEIAWQQTPAKFITKTKVVTYAGEKPSSKQIIGRSFARLIPFDNFSFIAEHPRGWHDKLSKTLVVPVSYSHEDVKKISFEKKPAKLFMLGGKVSARGVVVGVLVDILGTAMFYSMYMTVIAILVYHISALSPQNFGMHLQVISQFPVWKVVAVIVGSLFSVFAAFIVASYVREYKLLNVFCAATITVIFEIISCIFSNPKSTLTDYLLIILTPFMYAAGGYINKVFSTKSYG
jgi:uncharacterized RDD family membrane protein YckC